jgi:hypothetical protein
MSGLNHWANYALQDKGDKTMEEVGVFIHTTNGIMVLGRNVYIGSATIAIDISVLNALTMTRLYELGATMSHRSDHWRVQISKKYIKDTEFFDILD